MGGWSPEREVSLSSGRECAKALADRGYEVRVIDVGRDLPALMRALDPRPDVIFNALHGVGGEDGTIQGVFEMLGIPYTHSGVLASAWRCTSRRRRRYSAPPACRSPKAWSPAAKSWSESDPMPAPFVVKPTNQGSSVGVRIVRISDNSWREEVDGLALRRRDAGRALCSRARADRRGDGRSGARRLRDRPARQLLRLHREIRGGRVGSPDAGAGSAGGL